MIVSRLPSQIKISYKSTKKTQVTTYQILSIATLKLLLQWVKKQKIINRLKDNQINWFSF